ncbi:Dom-3 Z [Geranomyces variabilis]|nr:Dom-3 Z [Geranomyces variabilis]
MSTSHTDDQQPGNLPSRPPPSSNQRPSSSNHNHGDGTRGRSSRFAPLARPPEHRTHRDVHSASSTSSASGSVLAVDPIERFKVRCAAYQQPKEIVCFSYDEERKLSMGSDDKLSYYCEPDIQSANLSSGFPDRYVMREPVPERLDALLESMRHVNSRPRDPNTPPLRPAFCTWRGIMTKVLCAPFSRDRWELGATLHDGTIYIEEHEKRKDLYGSTDKDKLMSYMGYKFEALATIPFPPAELCGPSDPRLAERDSGTVNTNVQFCSVFKTKIGVNSIVMGAEVDCLLADRKPERDPQSAYAELKTNRVITNERQQQSFERHKLLKVWAQSFLPGIPTVIVGYRHDDGRLSHIEQRRTMDIPRSVRGTQPGIWDATVCINFADAFLTWLKEIVVIDDPDTVYTIEFDGRAASLLRTETGAEGPEGPFIPPWYRNQS